MTLFETYLSELETIRRTGASTKETSFYPAISQLFNSLGKTVKPRVHSVLTLKNQGAGMPDGGFFTASQLQRGAGEPVAGQPPERGAIEIKGFADDVQKIAASEQVKKYLQKYGLVLVTNYRDFLLVSQEANGTIKELERYTLAASAPEFWQKAVDKTVFAREHEARFVEYLKRVMQHNAPLSNPQEVAWFLASYARDAKARVETADSPALDKLREALEEALGIRFEGEKGANFFHSTLVQTLFYGVFSAWVLWHKENPTRSDEFRWREAGFYLGVPVIQVLFDEIAKPGNLKSLDLVEVLDWTASVLTRVRRQEFFARFDEGQAVQYFYEPFLQQFDPELRKQLGVWYTPNEIVKYMVARVDRVLREELNVADGLADPNVYVLDPCCGTGAYLVEVLNHIHQTLKASGEAATAGGILKKAAQERIFGFEILPAPFVVAHLQLGLLLNNLGANMADNERVGVYLTNALTGWDENGEPKPRLPFPEIEDERDQAAEIKQAKPILVVLGNPPYNAFAGTSPEEEQGLVESYKEGLIKKWGIKKFNLDELYVRFFRLAERRIAEKTGKGVVCYISNFSYLRDPSFVVMRERFLREFDLLWFDSLNGDSRETSKVTPKGKPDPSAFSTEYNREGIRVGTAVSLMVRKEERDEQPTVRLRQFWGANKRQELLAEVKSESQELQSESSYTYQNVAPDAQNRFSFYPSEQSTNYFEWAKLTDLCAIAPGNGLMEKRGGALLDIEREKLAERIAVYLSRSLSWSEYKEQQSFLTKVQSGFNPQSAREKILKQEGFETTRIVRYALRPFDTRWCYYTRVSSIWNRSRPQLEAQTWQGNLFLMSRPSSAASQEGVPFFCTKILGDNDFLRGHAYYFPFYLKNGERLKPKAHASLFDILGEPLDPEDFAANLSEKARTYLAALGIENIDESLEKSSLIWFHALAIGYAPLYLQENADGIKADFPRVPLPKELKVLQTSASLGKQVAALLDTEQTVAGVTTGNFLPPFARIGATAKTDGTMFTPEDYEVRANWGHGTGVVMPGKGKAVARDYTPEEKAEIESAAVRLGLTSEQIFERLGTKTFDVYLNDTAYWRNVPQRVWEYTIGGYQVMKKWLSYREFAVLGRALKSEEVREVMNTARRLTALVLLEPLLDQNYSACKGDAYKWD